MRLQPPTALAVTFALLWATSVSAQQTEIDALRAEVEALRADYEARIEELERRIAVAEQNARQASAMAQQPAATSMAAAGATGASSAFNPAIGVIFQGTAWHHSADTDAYVVPGIPFGGEAGLIDDGLALGETEISINANVDDKFTAWLTAPIAIEDGEAAVEVEEAWIETTAMPAGLAVRFGRFYSGIGYLNEKHLHSWDFADQPLPYQAFLGDQYLDDGVRLRWIAPTDMYVELGAEWMNGGRYPAGGSDNSGFGSNTLFAKIGGDIGTGSSWLAGLAWLDASSLDRPSGPEDDPLLFNGDSTLVIANFVWKWAPNGNWRQRNFVLQSEVFWRSEDGDFALPGASPLPYDADQTGWYLQAVYQPFPRWRFGGRIDGLSADSPGPAFDGTLLDPDGDDPMRYSLMADWSNTEFSRLRLQYTRDESGLDPSNQWGLQYILSIGAHGAHAF